MNNDNQKLIKFASKNNIGAYSDEFLMDYRLIKTAFHGIVVLIDEFGKCQEIKVTNLCRIHQTNGFVVYDVNNNIWWRLIVSHEAITSCTNFETMKVFIHIHSEKDIEQKSAETIDPITAYDRAMKPLRNN